MKDQTEISKCIHFKKEEKGFLLPGGLKNLVSFRVTKGFLENR